MKLSIAVLSGIVLTVVVAGKDPEPPQATAAANATNQFTITGMHCNGCARGLESELRRAKGVCEATVSFTNRLAVVAYDTNKTAVPHLVKAIREAGFTAKKTAP